MFSHKFPTLSISLAVIKIKMGAGWGTTVFQLHWYEGCSVMRTFAPTEGCLVTRTLTVVAWPNLTPVPFFDMSEHQSQQKRKASSPCVSAKGKAKVLDNNTTFDSISSFGSAPDSFTSFIDRNMSTNNMSVEEKPTDTVTIRITTREGEKFLGALSRPQAFSIWRKALKMEANLVSGIALSQSKDKPFLIVYHLHDDIDLNLIVEKFSILFDEAEFCGEKVVPRPPNPKLGEEVTIRVTKTLFKIRPYHVDQWVSRFGQVVVKASFKDAEDLPGITSDDIECVAILRKHIPGILPAFGRKMMLRYPGQPLLCGKCFDTGHLRARCEGEKVDWAAFVKLFIKEGVVPIELIGEWSRLLED